MCKIGQYQNVRGCKVKERGILSSSSSLLIVAPRPCTISGTSAASPSIQCLLTGFAGKRTHVIYASTVDAWSRLRYENPGAECLRACPEIAEGFRFRALEGLLPAPADPVCGLLLHKVKGAGAAFNAQAFAFSAGALRLLELGLYVVAIIRAFCGEDSGGIFSGCDQAVG